MGGRIATKARAVRSTARLQFDQPQDDVGAVAAHRRELVDDVGLDPDQALALRIEVALMS